MIPKKKRFVAKHLSDKIQKIKKGEEKEIIITWSRASTIISAMVGYTIGIHNGKEHVPIYIRYPMIGHKLGEFAPTRAFPINNDKDKKSARKKKSVVKKKK